MYSTNPWLKLNKKSVLAMWDNRKKVICQRNPSKKTNRKAAILNEKKFIFIFMNFSHSALTNVSVRVRTGKKKGVGGGGVNPCGSNCSQLYSFIQFVFSSVNQVVKQKQIQVCGCETICTATTVVGMRKTWIIPVQISQLLGVINKQICAHIVLLKHPLCHLDYMGIVNQSKQKKEKQRKGENI